MLFVGFSWMESILPLFQIGELEDEKKDLERNVNELKAKCEQIEKRAQEQRQVEEKKHTEEIQFLKRTNQQLKVCITYEGKGIYHKISFLDSENSHLQIHVYLQIMPHAAG